MAAAGAFKCATGDEKGAMGACEERYGWGRASSVVPRTHSVQRLIIFPGVPKVVVGKGATGFDGVGEAVAACPGLESW